VILWFIAAAACLYGGLVAALFAAQRRLLFRPGVARPDLGRTDLSGVAEISVTTQDGLSLVSWYLPPPPGRPVVLYLHGNGGHIGYRAARLRRFAEAGYGVLMLEYRGYGGNPGKPSEAGLYADAEAAMAFLATAAIPAERLVLWGESLGSAVAVHLAAERAVAGVVLEAPFTSVAAIAQWHYPFLPAARLVRDRFDARAQIGRLRAPVLVLHGGHDRVVPIRFGRALLAAAPEPKEGWFAPRAEHEDLGMFGALEAAIAFIERRVCRARGFVAAAPNFG
jgi:fermentation-respiration switch protein FrsA (DUF1100 family)